MKCGTPVNPLLSGSSVGANETNQKEAKEKEANQKIIAKQTMMATSHLPALLGLSTSIATGNMKAEKNKCMKK